MNKVYNSFDEAVTEVDDGAIIMVGGAQGPLGIPRNLLLALRRKGTKNLTLIVASGYPGIAAAKRGGFPHAEDWIDHSILIDNRQVSKVICCIAFVPGRESFLQELYERGEVEIENIGHGTLTSRIWAGAAGLGGIYNPVGIDTVQEEGKEKRVIDCKEYLFEPPLKADFSFIWAYKADKVGNLIYRGTGRQYGPLMAKAGKVTIAEVDEIVEPGELDPECIVTPGIYVHRIVKIPDEERV